MIYKASLVSFKSVELCVDGVPLQVRLVLSTVLARERVQRTGDAAHRILFSHTWDIISSRAMRCRASASSTVLCSGELEEKTGELLIGDHVIPIANLAQIG